MMIGLIDTIYTDFIYDSVNYWQELRNVSCQLPIAREQVYIFTRAESGVKSGELFCNRVVYIYIYIYTRAYIAS